jgi:hypothetical protein
VEEEVRKVLLGLGFRRSEIELETRNGIVGGFVTSTRSRGVPTEKRHALVWGALERHFTPKELDRIIPIFVSTPAEERYAELNDDVPLDDVRPRRTKTPAKTRSCRRTARLQAPRRTR